jgi:omega-6 fatty acid desaturase (delta-12 desaturase)
MPSVVTKSNTVAKCYQNVPVATLPDSVTLADVVKTIPKEAFQKNAIKAWANVLITFVFTALSLYLISIAPWYLLPFAWFFCGTAATGLFVIGHDCGHTSFSKHAIVNDVVGTITMLPLIFPFEPWRIQHNHHHQHTNKLFVDNAWQPFQTDEYEGGNAVRKWIMRYIKGPLWWMASIGHWQMYHFSLEHFKPSQQFKVIISLVSVAAFSVVFFPWMLYNFGVWGLIKYWAIPWFGFHFWMSTFTMVHHTLPFLPFVDESEWTDAKARLGSTVHCTYPKWIEFLCHQINVHIPHHVSTSIPSYNLWMAHYALKAKWSRYMYECSFGFDLLRDITTKCHLYDKQECYKPFGTQEAVTKKTKHN